MRRTLLIILSIFVMHEVMAQKQFLNNTNTEGSVNIAKDEINKTFIHAPARELLKSTTIAKATINVTYINFPDNAKAAFQYAVSIWEDLIYSPVTINIEATWKSMDNNILAIGKPSQFYQNFDGALISNVYYPIALAEKLSGKEITGSDTPDITCTINKNIAWYFGTDGNTPTNKYDFVTAVLHEITHGLGFSGFFETKNGKAFFNNSNNLPSIYDYCIFNSINQRISDANNFLRPSSELLNQLTSEKLKFDSEQHLLKSGTIPASLYAPSTWREGSSIYHLSHSDYHSDEKNALMTAFKYKGEAIHTPGDVTLEMLAEMGWKNVSFQFTEIKDFEESCANLPLAVSVISETSIDSSSVKVIYSTSYFTSKDSSYLSYNKTSNKFEGTLPLNYFVGQVQYYIEVTSKENKTFKLPSNAPNKKLSFRIGPDYTPPTVQHNPVKFISKSTTQMQLTTIAKDNLGVNTVKVEYKIDGIQQESFNLSGNTENLYTGKVNFSKQSLPNNKIEYRIVANDNSKNSNKVTLPVSGYYEVDVFEPVNAVEYYQSDFNSFADDFITADFTVSTPSGFANGALHTEHPYPSSAIEDEDYNLIAQLKYPVVLKENGKMTFDEVVLVEPGEPETDYTDSFFWDYVIVEGSKDNGGTWLPFTKGYDSQINNDWYTAFTNTLKSTNSSAVGDKSMYLEHSIDLTQNTGFYAGDTVLFRFRLSSDKSITGWGWAIDNLNIQNVTTGSEELVENNEVNVYPNPFNNNFYIDCSSLYDIESMNIIVTDLVGKTVFHETWTNTQYSSKRQVNLNNIESGIYLLSMTLGESPKRITKKIIKY